MATLTHTVTFDGINDVDRLPGRGVHGWSTGTPSFMDQYNEYYSAPNPGDDLDATGLLTGANWRLKTLRMAGDESMFTLRDLDNGADRRIDFLELGWNSDVDLISTRARFIFGWDGDRHDVTLGDEQAGSTFSINLYASRNFVTTGNAFVHSISVGGGGNATAMGDVVRIGEGGTGQISTGDGDDRVFTGDGGADFVQTNDGDDRVVTGDGFVESIRTGNGDDVVVTKAGGVETIRTEDGDDTVTQGTGYVTTIKTGDGTDTVTLGTGGTGFVRLGDGDDTVVLAEIPANYGVVLQGGAGIDTADFSEFSLGVTFSLDDAGRYQNVTNPTEDAAGTSSGYFSESSFENIIGTSRGDTLTGDSQANELNGAGGVDELNGGTGNDRLLGGGGNDRLFGEGGRDVLQGGTGRDFLDGGRGNDSLRGNGGNDVFIFGDKSGTDKVMDFDDGNDILRIADHSGGFGGLTIADQGGNLRITHDGGVILLIGEAGTTLTNADFDFV